MTMTWRTRSAAAIGAAVLMSLLFTTAASADPHTLPPIVVTAASRPVVGVILLTAPNRTTLYRDTDDPPNTPTCTGSCASVWPPYLLAAGDKRRPRGGNGVTGLGTVKLKSGRRQVTYKGEPLYTYVGDSGHSVNGNGVGPFEVIPGP